MEDIQKATKSFFITSLVFLFCAVGFWGIMPYLKYDPLLIEPLDSSTRSVVLLQQSEDLESLKKACLFWAEHNDSRVQFIDQLINEIESLVQSLVFIAIALSAIFGYGFFDILRRLKRYRDTHENKL